MNTEQRMDLISKEPTEEVVGIDELKAELAGGFRLKHYIGLEISGPLHLGSLLITGLKLRDFLEAGVDVTIFLADWHSYINDKLGGNWDRIVAASRSYERAFKAFAPGVNTLLGSELYKGNDEYWKNLIQLSKQVNMNRAKRTLTIMGRSDGDNLDMSQYLYPVMQANDIRALRVDIAHAGMDQRKVHMLVRDIFPRLGWKPPVAVHHHLLPSLEQPTKIDDVEFSKMSKSKPGSAIFIHDSTASIRDKLARAWCPLDKTIGNPVLEMTRYLVFHEFKLMKVERSAKYGGDIEFNSYQEVEEALVNRKLHPMDLKGSLASYIDSMVSPYRKSLLNDPDYAQLIENT
ncbi:MAG: tyrosine--tRNA ligase [Nitrososphaerota archaeon]|nr:tyrosine--tRNA ligase [Nitrososphaerota archaeon]MDG7038004.1 tyrosine--tRNA ligase [Nitrososphaerota archaeon]MDG7040043.1 tyrosine--tRNA ligase [Nitrososphaerota archaeon]MDG7041801.1 tyrosine--tRNA ligase [Nitrososphaerota archaeon]MDG7045323.1 tyrosine--tRNA ligase [Nitrososphaerota archaeon]